MPAGGLEWADPTDLEGLREAIKLADPEGRLAPIGMSRVEIGPDALDLLPEVVSELARSPRVVLAINPTPMRRGDDHLKAGVERLLAQRFDVRRAVIGEGRAALHADEAALEETAAALEGAGCVVVVGSGTITDVCKEATARAGSPPLVVVQTAASVDAFSDDVAVLLKAGGGKRTVPSRWPDALLVEIPVLACAPPAMNLAGFGDLISMWTAPADWYLASAVGMDDSYHEASVVPVALVREQGRELLEDAAGLRGGDLGALERLARVLTLSGFTLGVAGKTAPLSGTECPKPDGGLPDCAAMLAAVEASTGVRAEAVVGKPSRHMARTVLRRLGLPARDTLLVGDRLATDVRLAKEAGMAAALALTDATALDEAIDSGDRPDYVIGGLGELLPRGGEPGAAARAGGG